MMGAVVDALDTRQKVNALEAEMRKHPQVAMRIAHYFAQGVYGRELFIPKGVLLTGKIHKYSQINILLAGEISVLVDDEMRRVCAPFIVVSPPGVKRIALAHEDCRWLTILGTDLKDADEIERQFTAADEAEYVSFLEGRQPACLS